MNFESIMLRESSQQRKATYCMIPLKCCSGKGKTEGTENRSVIARGYWDGKNGEWLLMGIDLFWGVVKMF